VASIAREPLVPMVDATWPMAPVPQQAAAPVIGGEALPEGPANQVPYYPPWEVVCAPAPPRPD
jgi:hypothetical protein